MEKKFLLDMDGVIVNFVGGVEKLFNVDLSGLDNWDIHLHMGVDENDLWREIDAQGPEWWAELGDFPWTEELLDLLGDQFIISTSPSANPNSTTGKVMWMKKKFGKYFNDYMIGKHKHLMAGSGMLLIDDKEKNVDAFRDAGGAAVLFPQNYNRTRHVGDRMSYMRTSINTFRRYADSYSYDNGDIG